MSRQDINLSCLFLLLPVFFLSSIFSSHEIFYMRDLTYLFHPWRTLSAQFLQGGEMPLWNPYQMGGMPFLANGQTAILYPGTLLFYSLEFATALKIFYWGHYALASLGFFVLSRKLGFSVIASFAAGILYAYNGYLLTRLEFLSALGSLIWLPWSLLFVIGLENNRNLCIGGLTLTWLFSFLSGFPQIFLMQLIFTGAFCLIRKSPFKSIRALIISFILFLMLAAILWISMMELWQHSIRGGTGINFKEARSYSFPFGSLLGLLSPLFLSKHPDQFTSEKFFWIWSGWWGISASLIMILSTSMLKRKVFILSSVFFVIGLLWALGDNIPLYQILHEKIFLLRLFRFPPVALYWTVISACFLLLLGFKKLRTKQGSLIILGIIVTELFIYSRDLHPTINPSYYHLKFPNVEAIQNDRPGWVLLSPKANSNRRLPGFNYKDATTKFRSLLFDLTNLPYRIRTINASGEPLALSSFEKIWIKLKERTFIDLSKTMSTLNITHFISKDNHMENWTKINEDEGFGVYRNSEAMGEIFVLNSIESKKGEIHIIQPNKFIFENSHQEVFFNLTVEGRLITHLPIYPGWKINCKEHQEHPMDQKAPKPWENFLTTTLQPGEHHLHIVYAPKSWKLGFSLFSLGFIILIGILLL